MRNSGRESERATYEFLRNEGYCVESKEQQEAFDEMLARQLAEEQQKQLQQEEGDAALAAAVAALAPGDHEPIEHVRSPNCTKNRAQPRTTAGEKLGTFQIGALNLPKKFFR